MVQEAYVINIKVDPKKNIYIYIYIHNQREKIRKFLQIKTQ